LVGTVLVGVAVPIGWLASIVVCSPKGKPDHGWTGVSKRTSWTIDELRQDLRRFEDELIEANLKPLTIETYVQRSDTFLRWLDGKYEPSGPLAQTRGFREVDPCDQPTPVNTAGT